MAITDSPEYAHLTEADVETLGAALGLSAAQIDDLFRLAAQIRA